MTSRAGYSHSFAVSFCSHCSETSVDMTQELSIVLQPGHTSIGGAPTIEMSAILAALRTAGIREGTCQVQVHLTTKHIEVLSSCATKWSDHQCQETLLKPFPPCCMIV